MSEGRSRERQLGIPPVQMYTFNNQSELEEYLVAQ